MEELVEDQLVRTWSLDPQSSTQETPKLCYEHVDPFSFVFARDELVVCLTVIELVIR